VYNRTVPSYLVWQHAHHYNVEEGNRREHSIATEKKRSIGAEQIYLLEVRKDDFVLLTVPDNGRAVGPP